MAKLCSLQHVSLEVQASRVETGDTGFLQVLCFRSGQGDSFNKLENEIE